MSKPNYLKMKMLKSLFPLVLFAGITIHAQDISTSVQHLKDNISDVTIKDELYEQSFTNNENACICRMSVNNIEDEEHMEYLFNAADLNQYKIAFKTSKSSVYVEVETKGGKDLIRSFENGQVDDYVNDFEFYAKDIEQARGIVENFRSLVKECEAQQESPDFILGENPGIEDAVAFMKEGIRKVTVNDQSYEQSFISNADYIPVMKLEITDINEGEVIIYELNAADLNPAEIEFDTDDAFVTIEAKTRGGRELIKVYKSGELDGYQDELMFYTEGIEDARKLVEAFQFYVQESEKISAKEIIDIDNTGDLKMLNDFIATHLKDVALEDENYKQRFAYQSDKPYLVTMTIEEANEGEVEENHFNLADLNQNAVSFDTDGNQVVIEMVTTGENELIKVLENGELDEYDDDIEFMANGIEEARYLVEAFKKAIQMSKEMQDKDFIEGNASPSKTETVNFLQSAIGEVVIGEDAYNQKILSEEGNRCVVNYEVTDVSEGETIIYKFNLTDINVHKVKFFTDDKEVFISLQTVGENELIEEIIDGTTEGFENEIEIRAAGIEEARKIEKAIIHLINQCSE